MWSLVDETKNQQPTKIFKIGTSTLSGQIQMNARSFLIQFIESTCLSVTNVNHQWTITFWTWFHATYWFSLLYYFAAIRAKYVKKKVQFISTKGSKQPAFIFSGSEWSQHRWLLPYYFQNDTRCYLTSFLYGKTNLTGRWNLCTLQPHD